MGKLSRKQFDLLEKLATAESSLTQRDLEKLTGYSLGTVNRLMKELTEAINFQWTMSWTWFHHSDSLWKRLMYSVST